MVMPCIFTTLKTQAQSASRDLSNLKTTAINKDLVPGVDTTLNLGSSTLTWKNIYLGNGLYFKNALSMFTPGSGNFFVGRSAGRSTVTGINNNVFGSQSLRNISSGNNNTVVGFSSLHENTTGSDNVGIGWQSLYYNVSGYSNIAIGSNALRSNITGSQTIAIGDSALMNNTSNYYNVAIGSKALFSNTEGYYNVAVGYQALYANTTSGYNTGVGFQACYSSSGSAYDNTGIGFQSLFTTTSGSRNTGVGVWSLLYNTTGSDNVATGVYALEQNNTGSNNVATGNYSLFKNISGYSNVAMGGQTLFNNNYVSNLVAIGDSAMYSLSGGAGANTAVGSKSLYYSTSGAYETAIGYQALYSNTSGVSNTAVGYYSQNSTTTGSYNTATGLYSMLHNTTGGFNAGFGLDALYHVTTGSLNTAIGTYADINAGTLTNATAVGYNATATASNQVMLGNSSVTSVIAASSFTIYSDGRYKKDIKANVPGLEFINQLKPVTYHYDIHGLNEKIGSNIKHNEIDGTAANASNKINEDAIIAKEKILYTGFVAQDVETAAKKINYDFSGIHKPQGEKDVYGLSYSDFVVPLVKAVQELSKMNDDKDSRIDALEKEVNDLKNMVLSIQQKQDVCSPCSALTSQSLRTDGASLEQNNPNPFNQSATITYTLPAKFNTAQIVITDKSGNSLRTINLAGTGKGSVQISASSFSSGVYGYSLVIDGKLIATKQMVLTR